MAKKKMTDSKPVHGHVGKPKPRIGPITTDTIETGLEKLGAIQGELLALLATMKAASKDMPLDMDGPGLLPRGVNNLVQFNAKLTLALSNHAKM